MKRFQARKSNGRFTPNTLENTFGLSIVACPHCGRFNPYPANGKKPETCHACGRGLTPVGVDAALPPAGEGSERAAAQLNYGR